MEEAQVIPAEAKDILTQDARNLIVGEARYLTQEITAIRVTNEEAYKKAVELGVRNKKILKQIENFRKAILQPFNDQIKKVNAMFKSISARFEGNDELLRRGMLLYQSGRKDVSSVRNVNVTGEGAAHIKEIWTYEVVNPDIVPKEYCKPDETKIGRAVRAGVLRELTGVKIWKEKVTAFSTD